MSASLSMLAQAVRSLLVDATEIPPARIIIGTPHEAAKQQENAADEDYLCVFFYRVSYGGFPADAAPHDPLCLKAFCMITALGGKKTPGDSELKLIGAIAECFHRNTALKLKDDKNMMQAQIQIVPTQLTLDDINHLWSTQNNTPYRLSLSYEFAMLPVPIKARAERAPRVGAVYMGARSTESDNPVERRFFPLQVPVVEVDVKRTDWAPHICLLYQGEPTYTLETSTLQTPISLILLGDPNADVSLEWEIWNKSDRSWQTVTGEGTRRPAAASLLKAAAISITVPTPGNQTRQALLRATRKFEREGAAPRTISSNPVLITVVGGL